jgi:ketosteroid isomerase-like protein
VLRDTAGVSRENVQRIRSVYEQFSRTGAVDLELLDPDFESYDPPGVPDPRIYRGREGFLENLQNLSQAFDDLRWQPEDFIDAGDTIIVEARMSGRGKGSGVEVDQCVFHVWTIREERAAAVRTVFTKQEALEAAGLEE